MNPEQKNRITQNLRDAGCGEETIACFLRCYEGGDEKAEYKTLAEHRKCLLENLHMTQKQIDCLDFLVYQIEKENHNG